MSYRQFRQIRLFIEILGALRQAQRPPRNEKTMSGMPKPDLQLSKQKEIT